MKVPRYEVQVPTRYLYPSVWVGPLSLAPVRVTAGSRGTLVQCELVTCLPGAACAKTELTVLSAPGTRGVRSSRRPGYVPLAACTVFHRILVSTSIQCTETAACCCLSSVVSPAKLSKGMQQCVGNHPPCQCLTCCDCSECAGEHRGAEAFAVAQGRSAAAAQAADDLLSNAHVRIYVAELPPKYNINLVRSICTPCRVYSAHQ